MEGEGRARERWRRCPVEAAEEATGEAALASPASEPAMEAADELRLWASEAWPDFSACQAASSEATVQE